MVDFAGQKKELVLMWDAAAANIVWSRQQEGGTILAAAFRTEIRTEGREGEDFSNQGRRLEHRPGSLQRLRKGKVVPDCCKECKGDSPQTGMRAKTQNDSER